MATPDKQRDERLAAALRANLRRRKTQERGTDQTNDDTQPAKE
jgi:hypothetical protein